MIAMMWNDFNDGLWLFGGLVSGWGSPSGPAPPLALTPALSRPAGEGETVLRELRTRMLRRGRI